MGNDEIGDEGLWVDERPYGKREKASRPSLLSLRVQEGKAVTVKEESGLLQTWHLLTSVLDSQIQFPKIQCLRTIRIEFLV